jgi:hypothetical protein
MLRRIGQFTLLLTIGLVAGFFARAQLFIPAAVSLNAAPSSPSPGETFTVEAFTPSFPKETTRFSWTVNGQPRSDLSGFGRNSIELDAGSTGSVIRINLTVSGPSGAQNTTTLSVPISDLSLVWFAETLTPKWYKGKALPTPGSTVTVVALPDITIAGRALGTAELIFRWSVGDQKNVLTGLGENVFDIQTSSFPKASHQIRLVVEDTTSRVRKEKDLLVVLREPHLSLYAVSPLGGIEHRSSQPFLFQKSGGLLDIAAEPFFFPYTSKRDLTYQWQVAGTAIAGETPENPHILTLDTSLFSDSLALTATVQDKKNTLTQNISKTITLFLE